MEEHTKLYKNFEIVLRKTRDKWSCAACPHNDMKTHAIATSILKGGFESRESALSYARNQINRFLKRNGLDC